MTKDRARKQAARQRAALTGEHYVVAQRAIAEPQPQLRSRKAGRLHELTHRMPGVPAHSDGGLQSSAPRNHNSRSALQHHQRHDQQQHQHGEPRVLVAWQNWIARRLHASNQ